MNKIVAAVFALLLLAVIILAIFKFNASPVTELKEPVRFTFEIPGKSNPLLFWASVLAVSPDGQSIAYTDESSVPSLIKIRNINSFDSYAVRGTENGINPVLLLIIGYHLPIRRVLQERFLYPEVYLIGRKPIMAMVTALEQMDQLSVLKTGVSLAYFIRRTGKAPRKKQQNSILQRSTSCAFYVTRK